MMAEIGTPCGSSQCEEMLGHWWAGVVNREFGWAAFSWPGAHGAPRQSVSCGGTGPSIPSHHGSPWGVTATFVKIELRRIAAIMLGLVFELVPGATPKNPASGLMAHKRPSGPRCIQVISSPTVHTLYPRCSSGDTNMARLVLPQALGNAAAM